MKKMKRFLSLLLCMMMLVSLLPAGASAARQGYRDVDFYLDATKAYWEQEAYYSVDVEKNTPVTRPADPEKDGYKFVGWYRWNSDTPYDFTSKVTETLRLYAHWEQVVTHTVTVTANPAAGGTVSGGGTVNHGQSVTVTASPVTGYEFVNWTENGTQVSTAASYNFTVNGNRNLVANFRLKQYTVTVAATPTEGGNVTGGATVNHGQSVTVTATAATGYTFQYWKEGDNIVKNAGATYTFTAEKNRDLVAHFAPIEYTVTATSEDSNKGSAEVVGGNTHSHGSEVTVKATAKPGHTFVNWTENGTAVSSNPEYKFNVTANRNLVANFVCIEYAVTVNTSGSGSVSGINKEKYHYGETINLTATAEDGHVFVNWTEDSNVVKNEGGEPIGKDYTFTVTRNRALVANFVETHDVTVTATPNEGGTVSGGGTFNNGQSVTVTAAPAAGYNFVNWTEDGTVVSTDADYEFNVTADRALIANFVEKYLVSANVNIEGAGTVTGAGEHNKETTATLTATANTGYRFVNWTEGENVVGTDAPISFTVTGPRTLTANFIAVHTVTATAENGTVTGAGTYDEGATATLTATPATGYHFVNWTENGEEVSTKTTISFAVTANRNLVANFELNKYKVTATADPEAGAKKIEGAGEYGHGSTATLTATADAAYLFQNWTEDGEVVSTDATYSFTVTGERALVANFAEAVTITFDAKGKATNPTAQKIAKGAAPEKPADPENDNFNFDGWYVNADFSGKAYDFETGFDTNTTLYAKWTALHTVSFDLDHGTAEDASKVVAQKIKDGGFAIKPDTKVNKQQFYHHMHDLEFLGWYLGDKLYDFENTPVTGDITLKAKWGRMLHVINFYDGETLLKTVLVPEGEKVASVLTAPEDAPYLNGEWTCNQYDVHGKFDLHNKVVRTYCYDLQGKPAYKITFDGNGGTGTMEKQNALHGVETTLNENKFSKTGYAFNGWKDAAGKDYADKANIKVTADTTLTAQWTAKTYDAVFNANGGAWEENEVTKTVPTVFGEEIVKPADPTREGYEFTGWTPTNLIMDAEGKTFTAQWKAIEYTITYNGMEGATATPENPTKYTIEDADITLTDPEKPGFRFDGWTDVKGVKVEGVAIPANSTDDKTFTATWVAQFTVTFDRNGHGTAPAAVTVDTGVAVAAPTAEMTATGYTFGGWYTEAACTTAYDFATAVTADITLYAKWTPITYKVIFDPNGGELRTKSAGYVVQDFTYDAEQTLQKNAYVLSGHSFKGWNTRKNGDGTSYEDEAAVKNLASNQGAEVTLYAQWEKNAPVVNPVTKYKVTYDANGGSGTMGADTVEAGGEYTLLANKFTAPSGKVFKCWKINNKEYKPGEEITVDFDITVKAVWKNKDADLDYVPATGDNFSGFLWALLMLSGAVALVEVAVLRRKRR